MITIISNDNPHVFEVYFNGDYYRRHLPEARAIHDEIVELAQKHRVHLPPLIDGIALDLCARPIEAWCQDRGVAAIPTGRPDPHVLVAIMTPAVATEFKLTFGEEFDLRLVSAEAA